MNKLLEKCRLTPEEYNKVVESWKSRPLDNGIAGRNELIEILNRTQLIKAIPIIRAEIIAWGEEDCPHYPPGNEKKLYKSVPKRTCDKCWQSLKEGEA